MIDVMAMVMIHCYMIEPVMHVIDVIALMMAVMDIDIGSKL